MKKKMTTTTVLRNSTRMAARMKTRTKEEI